MINIEDCFVSPKTKVSSLLGSLEKTGSMIVLVVDDHQVLLGTVTDGDIRRALLHGAALETSAELVMNRQFRFVRSGDDKSAVLHMMKQEKIMQMPVLDEHRRVVDLLLIQELLRPVQFDNAVVIMVGGKGTRLRPYTEHCPKPMLLVSGRPMLEILLEKCIASGFSKFYFSVNYLKEQIIDHFDDGARWGVSIEYLVENEPLGTAGSLQLLPNSLTEPFLVLNGDVLTQLNYSNLLRFHVEHQVHATMCVREHELTLPFGVVQAKGIELTGFQEKPTYKHLVNTGLYVISRQLLPLLSPHQPTDMPTLLQAAQEAGLRVAVCPIHEYWLDVGKPAALHQAEQEWPS